MSVDAVHVGNTWFTKVHFYGYWSLGGFGISVASF